eukprot:5807024-Prymnesium_polylepis.2
MPSPVAAVWPAPRRALASACVCVRQPRRSSCVAFVQVFGWLKSGELSVGIDKVFPLSEAIAGHNYLEAGKSKGKLIYKI